jgi:hypothetical protein
MPRLEMNTLNIEHPGRRDHEAVCDTVATLLHGLRERSHPPIFGNLWDVRIVARHVPTFSATGGPIKRPYELSISVSHAEKTVQPPSSV